MIIGLGESVWYKLKPWSNSNEDGTSFWQNPVIPEDALAERLNLTSDSNIIPYSLICDANHKQATVQNSNSSAQQDALILSMIEQLKTQVVSCTKINLENKSVNDTLTAKLERYKEQVKEETLSTCEENRSKMLLKHKDNMMLEKEKQVDTTPIDYAALNQLYKDFPTRFVPQTELSAEQAFWSQNSMNSSELTFIRTTNVESKKGPHPQLSLRARGVSNIQKLVLGMK
ncbi:hypothetical protein Tco_0854788 [Tanacetum coccineum]